MYALLRAPTGPLALTLGLLLTTGATADDAPGKDKDAPDKKLLGTWKMVSIERNGEKSEPPIDLVFTFSEETIEQEAAGRSQTSKYKLYPEQATHLDILRERDGETRVFKLLFSVDGDTLRMCSGRPGSERPNEFTSEGGYSIQLLERVPAEESK